MSASLPEQVLEALTSIYCPTHTKLGTAVNCATCERRRDAVMTVVEPAMQSADRTGATIERMRQLIESYPPGSSFVDSGTAALFLATLDQSDPKGAGT